MGEIGLFRRFWGWLTWLPMRLAFRIVWLMAMIGNRSAEDVYLAMWSVNLALPRIKRLQRECDALEPEWALNPAALRSDRNEPI